MAKVSDVERIPLVQSEVVEAVKRMIKLEAGKKFDEANQIRTELENQGISVDVTKDGDVLLKKRNFINAMLIKEK